MLIGSDIREERESRDLRGPLPPKLALLPSGAPAVQVGTGVLAGSRGETLTFARSGAKYVEAPGSGSRVVLVATGNPAVSPRGLLIEPAVTNLVARSQQFDNASWTKSDTTVGADTVVAPDSTTTADVLTAGINTVDGVSLAILYQGFAAVDGEQYTLSVWAKAGTYDKLDIGCNNGAATVHTTFQLTSEWARYSTTITAHAAFIYAEVGWLGTHSVENLNVHVWGYQAEHGTLPHSYVPTTSADVTCAADVASLPATNLPTLRGRFEFDFIPRWSSPSASDVRLLNSLDAGHGNAGFQLLIVNDALNFFPVSSTGFDQIASSALTWTAGQRYRIRLIYGAGASALYRNGALVASGATAHLPDFFGALQIGALNGGALADGWISNLKVFSR